jgi:hypothetical protein
MDNKDKAIRGYAAADIIIEETMRDAKNKLEPYAKRENRKLDWWKGYYQGLVSAHCTMVLGQFPEHHENPKQIQEAIEREKQRRAELMK